MVDFNCELSFDAMSILKNWIWTESKYFESELSREFKKAESLHLCEFHQISRETTPCFIIKTEYVPYFIENLK